MYNMILHTAHFERFIYFLYPDNACFIVCSDIRV